MSSTWLVTAVSRGIGRELTAQLLAPGDRAPAAPSPAAPPAEQDPGAPAPASALALQPTELRAVRRADAAWLP
jgi:NAD(P)-dependent dehydrogenase (short-subunit alcohol dehydrogenase family)